MTEPNQNTQVAVIPIDDKPVQTRETLRAMLQDTSGAIASRLDKIMPVEKFAMSVMIAAENTPKVLDCSKRSVLMAVYRAAEVGLTCTGGILGQGYLIPYKGECKFVPGYRGLIDLLLRGTEYKSVDAYAVYEGDEFRVRLGTEQIIDHCPQWNRPPEAQVIAAYCVGTYFVDGKPQRKFVVLTRSDIDAVRRRNGGSVWNTDFAAMAMKTAIRKFCNTSSHSNEKLRQACAAWDEGEGEMIDVTDRAEGNKTQDAKQLVRPANVQSSKPGAPAPEVKTITGTVSEIAEHALEGTPGFLVYFADKSSEIPFPVFMSKRHVDGVVRPAAAGTVFTVNARPQDDIYLLISWGTIAPPAPAPAEKKDGVIDVAAVEVKP